MSRITNNIMISDFNNNFQKSQKKLNKYMNQLATNSKFSQISENPLDATRALKLKTTLSYNEKYDSNITGGIQWLATTDEALNNVNATLRKIRDLAVRGANDTSKAEDKAKLAAEVDQLKDHLIDIGNTKYGDKYIFNGTKTQTKLYQYANSTNVADYRANGDISGEKLNREVAQGIDMDINSSGNIVGADTGAGGGFEQIFADLKQLSDDLSSDNNTGIDAAIGKIDSHISQVLSTRGSVGARQNRLEMLQSRLEVEKINYSKVLKETEGIDIPETITNLKSEESVHRIALSVGARLIQPTLMDFLK